MRRFPRGHMEISPAQSLCPLEQEDGLRPHKCLSSNSITCPYFSGVTALEEVRCSHPFIFRRTNGKDSALVELVSHLDRFLEEINGAEIQRGRHAQYNKLDNIHHAYVVYLGEKPIACGAIRQYDENTVELKRMFVSPEARGYGVGLELGKRLESWARSLGYHQIILETNPNLTNAVRLYRKLGYDVIPKYGPYTVMPEALCMGKQLQPRDQSIPVAPLSARTDEY